MPLPAGNLTQPAAEGMGESGSSASKTVGEPTAEQSIHLSRIIPIKYCSHPELFLTEASLEYIPCELYEDPAAYQIRLSRSYSTFRPYYTHLRNLTVGTALRKDIQYEEDLLPEWRDIFNNIDLEGHSLQSFAKSLFAAAIDGGCCGVFVEYPETPNGLTAADERNLNYRPYFVVILSCDILGWTSEISQNTLGDKTVYGRKLTSLRIKDEVRIADPDDEFSEIVRPGVRVYDFDGIEPRVRHRQYVLKSGKGGEADTYVLTKSNFLSVTTIPFVPVYGGFREGFMLARPMLLDVARLNLHHWAVSADLANQLHLSAVPKLVISGVQGNSPEFENSPDKTLLLDKPEAKAAWIGAPMDGAQAVMDELKNIEEAMERLAAVAMSSKVTNQAESGFSKLLDRAQSDSLLAVLVQGLEEALNSAIAVAAEYWSRPSTKVALSRDFVPVRLHSQQILAYAELYNNNVISRETFLKILAVGDVFDGIGGFDVQEELQRVESDIAEKEERMAKAALIEKSVSTTGKETSRIVGARPGQSPESGIEAKEAARVSIPGS